MSSVPCRRSRGLAIDSPRARWRIATLSQIVKERQATAMEGSSGCEGTTHHGSEEDRMATTATTAANLTVKNTMNDRGNPPGKLAEAELRFGARPLDGLKLLGFSGWTPVTALCETLRSLP